MTIAETLILLLALEIYAGLISWKFYKQAGYPAWAAFVPVYNTYILTKIIQRPAWWVILFYIPIVGNVMAIVGVYELFHVFGRSKVKYTIFTILTGGLYLGYVNYTQNLKYQGRDDKTIRKYVSDLTSSLFFAVVAATIIRTFTFEAFTIPTPSMEKSLLVGDFLFVSKMQYGCRMPITPLSIPLVHNRIPGTDANSYLEWIQLPYLRLPKFSEVERMDPVVFNYPMDDFRPIDKRDHYVKRCVAVAGDTLEIIDGQVYIDGAAQEMPDRARPQFSYYVKLKPNQFFSPDELKERFGINYVHPAQQTDMMRGEVVRLGRNPSVEEYIMFIPTDQLEALRQYPKVEDIVKMVDEENQASRQIFPNSLHADSIAFKWTRDNYGPLYIPRKGDVVELNAENYLKFNRIIRLYEGNELEKNGQSYFINGVKADTYTFQQDYYWMMGDNRHNSLDSRYWGYVPADHIVGKPVFIWMSWDKYTDGFFNGIRTNRVFTTVSGVGERVSYFWPFVGIVLLLYILNIFRKQKKKKVEDRG